jgi:uncharacterized protein
MEIANLEHTLRVLLGRHAEIKLAILFGSLAAGTAQPDSDIDIAVQGHNRLSVADKVALIDELAEVIGRPVDLIDLQTAGEPLLGEILKGRRMLGSDDDHARLLTRHLIDAADFLPLQQRILKERRDTWIR